MVFWGLVRFPWLPKESSVLYKPPLYLPIFDINNSYSSYGWRQTWINKQVIADMMAVPMLNRYDEAILDKHPTGEEINIFILIESEYILYVTIQVNHCSCIFGRADKAWSPNDHVCKWSHEIRKPIIIPWRETAKIKKKLYWSLGFEEKSFSLFLNLHLLPGHWTAHLKPHWVSSHLCYRKDKVEYGGYLCKMGCIFSHGYLKDATKRCCLAVSNAKSQI